MLPAPPLLPFQRLQRLSPLTQLGDVAISRADSGVHVPSPAQPLDRACELTCPPSGVFPSHPAFRSSPRHQQAGFLFTERASPLAVGSHPPPLYSQARYCYLAVLQRVVCVPRPQGIAPTASPLRPPPERRSARYSHGLCTCMVGKVVRIPASSPRRVRHHPSEQCLPSSCAPDLSVSCCSHPPAQCRCSHTVSRPPPRMRSAASPPPPPRQLQGVCGSRVGLGGSSARA